MTSTKEMIVAYKGFTADWKCRDFQFEVGKSYTHDGEVALCSSGFHACEYPLDCFNYYEPTGKFALVGLSEVDQKIENESKRVARSITIKAALSIFDLVSASIEYTTKRCVPNNSEHATGYQSASSATGKNSVAMNIGIAGKAKGGLDAAIVLCNHDENGNIRHIRASKVGENGIKPDCWYCLDDNCEFMEVKV